MGTKFPEVTANLIGIDSNAFSIISAVREAMRRAGVDKTQIEEFTEEATSGDYDNVLQTAIKWVTVL